MDPIDLLGNLISVCQFIYKAHETAKANREQIRQLGERVYLVQGALERLRGHPADAQMIHNFNALYRLLEEIQQFVQTYREEKKWFKRLFKAGSDEEQFRGFQERLQQQVTQMNFSVSAEAFARREADAHAERQDHQLIQRNEKAILELNQIALHHFDALGQQGGRIEVALKGGLYQVGEALGNVVSELKAELAKRDKRMMARVDEVHEGVMGLGEAMAGMRADGQQHQDVLLLQLQSMRRQFAQAMDLTPKVKPPIDPKLIIPLYELDMEEKPFAIGSFGQLHRAQYQYDTVAVKLFPSLSDADAKQFYREVEIMSRLRFKHIAPLYGASVTQGRAVMVMAYMEQGDLKQYLATHQGTLTWEKKHQLMKDVSAGLAYLHDHGVVHRDLKSPNILIDEASRALISDFGLSRAQKMSVQSIAERSTACSWLAPEYFSAAGKVDEPSDMYSLGVVLLEIATAQPPMAIDEQGLTPSQNKQRIGSIPFELSEQAKELIMRCLSWDQGSRPNAGEVASQLSRLTLRPPSPSGEDCYEKGNRCLRDQRFDEAEHWFRRSMRKGIAKAATNLGLFCIKKMGSEAGDIQAAAAHFQQAAALGDGDPVAMLNLTNLYGYDEYGLKDLKQAYTWAERAMQAGNPKAKALYDKFKARYEATLQQSGPAFEASQMKL